MDFHIRLRTAHRRLARPAHPSCPHPGDERRKLSARHQQEGTAAIGPGAKPKPENAKRRRPRHRNIIRHGSTKINRASQPFSLNPTGTLSRRPLANFVSAIDIRPRIPKQRPEFHIRRWWDSARFESRLHAFMWYKGLKGRDFIYGGARAGSPRLYGRPCAPGGFWSEVQTFGAGFCFDTR